MYPQYKKSAVALCLRAAGVFGLALGTAGCSDRNGTPSEPDGEDRLPASETRTISAPQLPTLRSSAPVTGICGTPVEFTLSDGNHRPGKVVVSNDAEKVYITYSITTQDWFISDTRLAVNKSIQSIPRDANGKPMPWSFPVAGEHDPVVTAYTYTITLADLAATAGTRLYVSAMAGVVHPTTASYEGPWEWLVVWGLAGGSSETIHTYTVASCGSQPPPPPPAAGGAWTITFDDGWLTTYTRAYPVLNEFGLRANVAVNPDAIDGQWTGYLTLTQLRELHAAGWGVVSHSLSHRDLTTLSDSELHRELRDSKAWIERYGFRGAHIFAVPFHSWGTRERAAIQQYYRAARGYTVDQFWPDRYARYPVTEPYDLTGYEPEWAPFMTAQGRELTRQYVERAVNNGEFVDLFFHQITAEQLPAFRQLMQLLAQYKSNLKIYSEVVQ